MLATKAKKIIDLNIKVAGRKMPADTLDALKLANQALARHIKRHYLTGNEIMLPLPGETVITDSPKSLAHHLVELPSGSSRPSEAPQSKSC